MNVWLINDTVRQEVTLVAESELKPTLRQALIDAEGENLTRLFESINFETGEPWPVSTDLRQLDRRAEDNINYLDAMDVDDGQLIRIVRRLEF